MGTAGVLVYHRIVDDAAAPTFYDVDFSTFRRQTQRLAGHARERRGPWIDLDTGRAVAISFDDGTADHADAAEILAEYGLCGVFFIVAGLVDTPGYLTSDQVAALAEAGHVVASHSLQHIRLPKLDDETLDHYLVESKRRLEDLAGRPVTWLAPPGGAHDARVVAAATDAGYSVIRTMDWGYTEDAATGVIPGLPVFRSYDEKIIDRIVRGRAPMWRYRSKQLAKKVLPGTTYHRLRDLTSGSRRG